MKRISNILMCVFALLFSAKASAQQLQFEANAEVQQGQTATLNVVLNNSEAIRGFQFDLTLPEGLTPVISKVGETGHDLSVSKVGESKYRVLSYSLDNAEYSVDFGTVASVSIAIPEDFAVGNYSIVVSEAYLSSHDNSKVAVDNFSAILNVLPKYIPVESVTLNSTALSLLLGQSANLSATVSPEDATEKAITWSTSDSSVATISADGNVLAVGLGTATITATAANGVKAECVVTVNPIISESITLNHPSLSLLIGEEETLVATVLPENTTDKNVVWSSSNTAVATVDSNGKVVAIAVGTTIITAKNGTSTATCEVTVSPILAESVTLNQTELSLLIGQSAKLTATVSPENTTDKTLTWTSSDNSIATVDNDGNVTAIAVGEATITVTAVGGAKAECKVTVSPIVSEGVVINKTALTLLIGEEETLVATVLPENATDKNVVWSSSNTAVATVDNNGKVAAIAVGTTIITAKNGTSTATCEVTVNPNAYTITYLVDGEVYHTETVKIGATITPIAEPTKEGHTFSGWSEIPETMPAHDVTVTGTFTVNKYMVRYYDGETLLAEFEVEFGAEIPQYEYNNEEFIFEGWEGETYETMPAHDIAFYAITTPNGIETIQIDDNAEITVYDLTGMTLYKGRKAGLPKHLKGLYIIKYGCKAIKCRL